MPTQCQRNATRARAKRAYGYGSLYLIPLPTNKTLKDRTKPLPRVRLKRPRIATFRRDGAIGDGSEVITVRKVTQAPQIERKQPKRKPLRSGDNQRNAVAYANAMPTQCHARSRETRAVVLRAYGYGSCT